MGSCFWRVQNTEVTERCGRGSILALPFHGTTDNSHRWNHSIIEAYLRCECCYSLSHPLPPTPICCQPLPNPILIPPSRCQPLRPSPNPSQPLPILSTHSERLSPTPKPLSPPKTLSYSLPPYRIASILSERLPRRDFSLQRWHTQVEYFRTNADTHVFGFYGFALNRGFKFCELLAPPWLYGLPDILWLKIQVQICFSFQNMCIKFCPVYFTPNFLVLL